MARMSLNFAAIEERFDRIRKEKRVARSEQSLRLAELKREGEFNIEARKQEGLTRRAGMPKPWFDRRHEELQQRAEAEATLEQLEVTETGLEERRKLSDVAAERRAKIQFGAGSPAMITAGARKTAAGRLASVGEAKEKAETTKLNLEDYDRNASGLLYKLGMITYLDGEKQINPAANRLFRMHEAMAAEDPEEAMRALEFGLESINAKKAERLENKDLTDEEIAAKRAQINKENQVEKEMEQEALLKEQFPSLIKTPKMMLEEMKPSGARLTQRKMTGGARTGILGDIRKPGKWFKSYADLREAARQRI